MATPPEKILSLIDGVKRHTKAEVKLIAKALDDSQESKRLRKEHEEKKEVERFEKEREEKLRIKQERELEQLKLKELEESSYDVKQEQEKKQGTFEEEFLTKPIVCKTIARTSETQNNLDEALIYEAYRTPRYVNENERYKSYEKMSYLISQGANINKVYESKAGYVCSSFTSLHLACYFQDPILIEFLLINGADSTLEVTKPEYFDPTSGSFIGMDKDKWPFGGYYVSGRFQVEFNGKQKTPSQLYKRFPDPKKRPNHPSYEELLERAKIKRASLQQIQYTQRLLISALMIANYQSNKGITVTESIHDLFPTILKFIDQDVSEQDNILKASKNSFVQSTRLRFFEEIVATRAELDTECRMHKSFEDSILHPTAGYFKK